MRALFLIGTTAFWLTMTSLLIQRQFFQISAVQTPYEVLPIDLESREEYTAIMMGGEQVGFSFTALQPLKKKPYAYELRHQTFLSFLFLGQQREMLTRGTAKLDPNLNLLKFKERISSSDHWTEIKGQRAKGNLNVIIDSSDGEPERRIIPVKGPVFFSEALRFLWTPENLVFGKKGTLQTWNPLMTSFQTLSFHVAEKTMLKYQGRPVKVFVIHMNFGGFTTRTWVTPEGVVLKEEGFTGVTQIKKEGWQIFDTMRKKKAHPPDLPNLFSIPSNEILENPEALTSLHVKITTPNEEKIMSLYKQDLKGLDTISLPVSVDPKEFARALEATPWVEASDPEIAAQAKKIIGGTASAKEASLKILKWVHENISPVPSMGIPKAKQVLADRKGDCNEYTVLFTALARAAGIPTRMIAGLVYQNGRFFYHAWPEVYLGRWIGLDPTFGQAPVDVAHIPLIEGDLEEQVALVTQIGRIKIQIMPQPDIKGVIYETHSGTH